MKKYKVKTIDIGYDLNSWCIGFQFIKFTNDIIRFQFLCIFIEWNY